MAEGRVKGAHVWQKERKNISFKKSMSYNDYNTFLKDISSTLFILKLTGMLPIYQTKSKYELVLPTGLRRIYMIIVHILVHLVTAYNLYNVFTEDATHLFNSSSDTDNINYWIEILLSILTYTTTMFVCFKNAKYFLKILNAILKLDQEVNHKFSSNLINNCEFAVVFITLIALLQWYIFVLKILESEEPLTVPSYILIGFYSVQNSLSPVFIVYASILLRILTVRFAILNCFINGYTYRQQQVKMRQQTPCLDKILSNANALLQTRPMENFSNDFLFVFRMYNQLLRLYKIINENCSLVLVVYMGYAFYSITNTAYNIFVQLTTQLDVSLVVLQMCFALLFIHITMLALLSRCSGQATVQANETSRRLASVYGKSKEHQNIIDKFLTKTIKQEVQFSAYGFFVIDGSTLFKIFSAVTTYLVILIQFKQLEESKKDDQSTLTSVTARTNPNL